MASKVVLKNELVVDTETTNKNPHKAQRLGVSYKNRAGSFYDTHISQVDLHKSSENEFIIAHNGKYDSIMLGALRIDFDTMLAYYLLHIDKPRKLETILKNEFGIDKKDLLTIYNEHADKPRKKLPDGWWEVVPEEVLAKYAQEDVEGTYKIYKLLKAELEAKPDLYSWFNEVEMPLLNILVKSELTGVKLDVERMKVITHESQIRRDSLLNNMRVMAGNEELNVNSSKQLQDILFKKLKLPKLIKTKTGWSTQSKVLERLKSQSGFVRNLLEYKKLEKLLNSFLTVLPQQVDGEQRLHPTYNQALTKTRRFSCEDPNLQQIPSRGELAKKIRQCFIPKKGYKFLVADYSQIELRLLAHFSKEPKLIEAFNKGTDLHQQTADYIGKQLGIEFTRDKGKLLNFSIVYGKSAYGFAQDWNCSESDAQEILDAYFNLYPKVKEYIENQKLIGRNNRGWIKSLAGLPLYIDKANSSNKWEYEEAGRQIVNYRIQSSSQDIIKKAIVNIYKNYNLVPLLMVHDELVFEIPDKKIWLQHGTKNVVNEMTNAFKLSVPIEVDYKITDCWEK